MTFNGIQTFTVFFFILFVSVGHCQEQVIEDDVELIDLPIMIKGDISEHLYQGELLNSTWKIVGEDTHSFMVFRKNKENNELTVGMVGWDDEAGEFVVDNDHQLVFNLGTQLLFCKKVGDSIQILWGGEISDQQLRFGEMRRGELLEALGQIENRDIVSLIENLRIRVSENLFMFEAGFSCRRVSNGQ